MMKSALAVSNFKALPSNFKYLHVYPTTPFVS
jgi:hypothetical protein